MSQLYSIAILTNTKDRKQPIQDEFLIDKTYYSDFFLFLANRNSGF